MTLQASGIINNIVDTRKSENCPSASVSEWGRWQRSASINLCSALRTPVRHSSPHREMDRGKPLLILNPFPPCSLAFSPFSIILSFSVSLCIFLSVCFSTCLALCSVDPASALRSGFHFSGRQPCERNSAVSTNWCFRQPEWYMSVSMVTGCTFCMCVSNHFQCTYRVGGMGVIFPGLQRCFLRNFWKIHSQSRQDESHFL